MFRPSCSKRALARIIPRSNPGYKRSRAARYATAARHDRILEPSSVPGNARFYPSSNGSCGRSFLRLSVTCTECSPLRWLALGEAMQCLFAHSRPTSTVSFCVARCAPRAGRAPARWHTFPSICITRPVFFMCRSRIGPGARALYWHKLARLERGRGRKQGELCRWQYWPAGHCTALRGAR